MLKHRGFPSRLPSSDLQFTVRRANLKSGATKITRRERFRDRKPIDRAADRAFLSALIEHFGDEPFERGNLDAGRLSWLIGREVVAVGAFDPASYDQMFRVDLDVARASFPEIFAHDDAPRSWEDFAEDFEDFDDEDDDITGEDEDA